MRCDLRQANGGELARSAAVIHQQQDWWQMMTSAYRGIAGGVSQCEHDRLHVHRYLIRLGCLPFRSLRGVPT